MSRISHPKRCNPRCPCRIPTSHAVWRLHARCCTKHPGGTYEQQRQKDALQKILDDNFNQCTRLACGPGAVVMDDLAAYLCSAVSSHIIVAGTCSSRTASYFF
jgi:hypothetical protein